MRRFVEISSNTIAVSVPHKLRRSASNPVTIATQAHIENITAGCRWPNWVRFAEQAVSIYTSTFWDCPGDTSRARSCRVGTEVNRSLPRAFSRLAFILEHKDSSAAGLFEINCTNLNTSLRLTDLAWTMFRATIAPSEDHPPGTHLKLLPSTIHVATTSIFKATTSSLPSIAKDTCELRSRSRQRN